MLLCPISCCDLCRQGWLELLQIGLKGLSGARRGKGNRSMQQALQPCWEGCSGPTHLHTKGLSGMLDTWHYLKHIHPSVHKHAAVAVITASVIIIVRLVVACGYSCTQGPDCIWIAVLGPVDCACCLCDNYVYSVPVGCVDHISDMGTKGVIWAPSEQATVVMTVVITQALLVKGRCMHLHGYFTSCSRSPPGTWQL